MQTRKQSLMSMRGQMATVGVVLWFLLALWSIAAFWQHIDELKPTYPNVTKLGAIAGEVALLALVLWHCFSKHIGVRFWALMLSFALSAAILVHAGALRGMAEAQTAQVDAEKRLEETLTRMSKEQMGQTRQRAKVAETAQKQMADTVRAGKDTVRNSSILPRWYLDGWMYSALFLLSLACVGIIFALMMRNDIDADFDGVADHLQQRMQLEPEISQAMARYGREPLVDNASGSRRQGGEVEELETLYGRPTGKLEGKGHGR